MAKKMPMAAIAACFTVLCAPTATTAEPLTVETLLQLEKFGAASLSPSKRQIVLERLGPVDPAPPYDFDYYNHFLRSELLVARIDEDMPARRLLAQEEGRGHVIGEWSPSGRRLLIYRLRGHEWTAGVVEMNTGAVQWLDFTPSWPVFGRTAQWRDDDTLLIFAHQGDLPRHLEFGWRPVEDLQRLWAASATGSAAGRISIGAGAFATETPLPPPLRLLQANVVSGDFIPLAEGRFEDMELSPDGRQLALISREEPLEPVQGAPFLQGGPRNRLELTVLDLDGGKRWSPNAGLDTLGTLLAWSSQGRLMTWARTIDAEWASGALRVFDPADPFPATVELQNVAPFTGEWAVADRSTLIYADWLGEQPLLYGRDGPGRPAHWFLLGGAEPRRLTGAIDEPDARLLAVSEDAVLVSGDGAIWRLTAEHPAQRLTKEEATPVFARRRHGGQRLLLGAPPRRDRVAIRRPDGALALAGASGVGAETAGVPGARLVDFNGEAALFEAVDAKGRARMLLSRGDKAPVSFSFINTRLGQVDVAEARKVEHRAPDGSSAVSWLYLPTKPSGTPPPLIIVVYPGAAFPAPYQGGAAAGAANTATNIQLLAGAGYAVLQASLPRTHSPNEPVAGLAAQILEVVEAARPLGGFDADQLILWGHSFGGYGVLAAGTQSDAFAGIVSLNGFADLAAFWGGFILHNRVSPEYGLSIRNTAGAVEEGQAGMRGPPWSNPERYVRNSPLYQADQITAPLLLVGTDMDYVALAGAEAMFTAMHRQGKDALMLTYFGEGHVLSSPANVRDFYQRAFDWIETITSPNFNSRPGPNSPAPRPE